MDAVGVPMNTDQIRAGIAPAVAASRLADAHRAERTAVAEIGRDFGGAESLYAARRVISRAR
jgi:hypothetical protein